MLAIIGTDKRQTENLFLAFLLRTTPLPGAAANPAGTVVITN